MAAPEDIKSNILPQALFTQDEVTEEKHDEEVKTEEIASRMIPKVLFDQVSGGRQEEVVEQAEKRKAEQEVSQTSRRMRRRIKSSGSQLDVAQRERSSALSSLTLEGFKAVIDQKAAALEEVISSLDYSRHYEDQELRFPTEEEFRPLVKGWTNFVQERGKLYRIQGGIRLARQYYNEVSIKLIRKLAKQIQEHALQSRNREKEKLQAGKLKPRDPEYTTKDYIAVVDAQIRELTEKPIERSLLELRALLNVQLFDYDRKASRDEIEFFKLIWGVYEKAKRGTLNF